MVKKACEQAKQTQCQMHRWFKPFKFVHNVESFTDDQNEEPYRNRFLVIEIHKGTDPNEWIRSERMKTVYGTESEENKKWTFFTKYF